MRNGYRGGRKEEKGKGDGITYVLCFAVLQKSGSSVLYGECGRMNEREMKEGQEV